MTAFDEVRFREVLGHVPTGVTIVTASTTGGPVGMTVGSFTSLSLRPPRVLFCADHGSSTWPRIRAAGLFCINVLAAHQVETCRAFARHRDKRFAGVSWRRARNGAPLLDETLAHVECRVEQVVPVGDHDIVVGAVTDLDAHHDGDPLVFFRARFGSFTG